MFTKPLSVTRLLFAVLFTAGLVLTAQPASAFGSKEKSPEQEATDNAKKAVGKYNDGVKQMETARAIAARGDSVYAYNYRATSDAKAKKAFEKAVDLFLTAIKLKPDMAEAYNNLGYCYRKLGKLYESLDAYQKAITLKTDFAQAREYRGETYLALGDLDKAQTEHQFLTEMKSPLADTLAKSIELYQLQKIEQKTQMK
jgi:tetratricopeptide (TPR) repeat protein